MVHNDVHVQLEEFSIPPGELSSIPTGGVSSIPTGGVLYDLPERQVERAAPSRQPEQSVPERQVERGWPLTTAQERVTRESGGVPANIVLVRHGATEWSRNGRHTGRTDLDLDAGGRLDAGKVGQRLAGRSFDSVWSSPLLRARETCALAGFGSRCVVLDDLAEWDYGAYEGLTTAEIHKHRPGWHVFLDGAPGGESPAQVGARADRVLATIGHATVDGGSALVFSHGHFLRMVAARWLGLDPSAGRHFVLDAGSIGELAFERDVNVLVSWNC